MIPIEDPFCGLRARSGKAPGKRGNEKKKKKSEHLVKFSLSGMSKSGGAAKYDNCDMSSFICMCQRCAAAGPCHDRERKGKRCKACFGKSFKFSCRN